MAVNRPCTITADGKDLQLHEHIGGHPEWGVGNHIIGAKDGKQVLYNVVQRKIVGQLGNHKIFPKPEGDISLSPDGRWFANGFGTDGRRNNAYSIFRLSDQLHLRSTIFSRGPYQRGELRIDPAPRWSRTSDSILVPSMTKDGTRQLHIIHIRDDAR